MRSVVYRSPDLSGAEGELPLPAGETADDGEWLLAVFDFGTARRATSAAARAAFTPEGTRLFFEPRDWHRVVELAREQGVEGQTAAPPPSQPVEDRISEVPATAPSPVTPPPTRPPASGSRVLIVDDDPDIRDVVSAMLEAVGLSVVAVESAEAALERIHTAPFDLLVLDWNLPKMTGLELCRAIRREAAFTGLPVLFLTANASSQDMVEGFASGGDDYVVKPFRAPELGARIFSLLRRTRVLGSGGV